MSAVVDGLGSDGNSFTFPNGAPVDPHAYRMAAQELIASRHFINASVTMLIFDHFITFEDEVERIWKPKFTGATLLFLLNRYFTPLTFIVNIASFHDEAWTKNIKSCRDFVKFPGAATLVSIAIVEIVLITRTYALYGASNRPLLAFLVFLFLAQMVLMGVSMHFTHMLEVPPGLTGCILTGSTPFFAAFWTAPLVTDTVVFVLTLWKTGQYFKQNVRIPLLVVLRRDGILYFGAIFAANLMNVLIYLIAPVGIKAIGASFSQLVTNVMISRLQLNLRHPRIRTSIRSFQRRGATNTTTTPDYQDATKSSPPDFTLSIPATADGTSNFFTETLRSLGRPMEDETCYECDYCGGDASDTCYCSSATMSPISPTWKKRSPMRSRFTMCEIEEYPMDDLSSSSRDEKICRDMRRARFEGDAESVSNPPMPVVDTAALFPPSRDEEQNTGISISDALIDSPHGPVLYDNWRASRKNSKKPGKRNSQGV